MIIKWKHLHIFRCILSNKTKYVYNQCGCLTAFNYNYTRYITLSVCTIAFTDLFYRDNVYQFYSRLCTVSFISHFIWLYFGDEEGKNIIYENQMCVLFNRTVVTATGCLKSNVLVVTLNLIRTSLHFVFESK